MFRFEVPLLVGRYRAHFVGIPIGDPGAKARVFVPLGLQGEITALFDCEAGAPVVCAPWVASELELVVLALVVGLRPGGGEHECGGQRRDQGYRREPGWPAYGSSYVSHDLLLGVGFSGDRPGPGAPGLGSGRRPVCPSVLAALGAAALVVLAGRRPAMNAGRLAIRGRVA